MIPSHLKYKMRFRNLRLGQLVNLIPDPRKPIIADIYQTYRHLIHSAPGSSHNHQNWEGGLADHYADLLRRSWFSYQDEDEWHQVYGLDMPYTLGSLQIALWCHDAEKFVVYGSPADPLCAPYFQQAADPSAKIVKEGIKWQVLETWRQKHGLILTEAEINAIKYTHGEGDDYDNTRRVMNELAAHTGNLDRASARITYAAGKDSG